MSMIEPLQSRELNRSAADCACSRGPRGDARASANPTRHRHPNFTPALLVPTIGRIEVFRHARKRSAARLFTLASPRILPCMKRIPIFMVILVAAASLDAQRPAAPAPANDPIRTLVSRLDLEKYQGHYQGPHRIWRSAPGHHAQPQGGRLDRSAAQKLRLRQRRAPDL
jgi:hypothetical protein